MRIWRGATAAQNADAYVEYLEETGIREYRETEGNLGTATLRRQKDRDVTEFVTISFWPDMEAIKGFAGPDPEVAVFYDEDERFLVEGDSFVRHFEIVDAAWPEQYG